MKVAAPRLKEWGYLYDKSQEDRAITYGFRKLLMEDIQATIQFQRHQYDEVPIGLGFTINLERHGLDKAGRMLFRHTAGDFSFRLGNIFESAYGLRLYPYSDQWWEGATVGQIKAGMDDALRRLERYGIPALEDLDFRMVLPGGFHGEWNTFHDTIDAIAAADLSRLGYESKVDPDNALQASLRPRRHFVKRLDAERFGFIGFEPLQCYHRPKENDQGLALRWFAVSIAVKRSSDPNAELDPADKATHQGWLGPATMDRVSLKPIFTEAAVWEHAALALPLQLSMALDKIKQVGIPMLEQSFSQGQ